MANNRWCPHCIVGQQKLCLQRWQEAPNHKAARREVYTYKCPNRPEGE